MTDRNLRVERIKELCRLQGIDRSTFLDKTGYSDSQLSAWLSPASATCICKPNTEQICPSPQRSIGPRVTFSMGFYQKPILNVWRL